MRFALLLMTFLLVGVVFAGCAEETQPTETEDDSSFDGLDVEVSDETGAIRGVVVNQAVVPIAGAKIVIASIQLETESDEQGRFTFSNVEPGTYFMDVSKPGHETNQAGVVVEAGVEQPEVVKVQLTRLFDQDPYYETQGYLGFVGCAYNFGISSTCVNDYTRIIPVCGNGCAPQVTGIVDQREFQSTVDGGWQSIIWEMVWDSSVSGTAEEMQITVSYAERIGASHWYTSSSMAKPYRLQCDLGANCPEMSTDSNNPEGLISPDGQDNLWNMISAGDSDIALQQNIEVYQTNFYYANVPDGWSFVRGDPNPF